MKISDDTVALAAAQLVPTIVNMFGKERVEDFSPDKIVETVGELYVQAIQQVQAAWMDEAAYAKLDPAPKGTMEIFGGFDDE